MTTPGPSHGGAMRALALDLVRVTEKGALAAFAWRGRGDEEGADLAATAAMREELDRVPMRGRVVNGGRLAPGAPLAEGLEVGTGEGAEVDISVDPLEGRTLCAKDQPGALCVLAVASAGGLARVSSPYMEKLAIGPACAGKGRFDIDMAPGDLVREAARARGLSPAGIVVCVLDRPRHARLIDEVRAAGATVRLIGDGDIAGAMCVGMVPELSVDLYLGIGGSTEGVLAATAFRTLGGAFFGRLTDMPFGDRTRVASGTTMREAALAAGDVVFAATGITDGAFLSGLRRQGDMVVSDSLLLRSGNATRRRITTWQPLSP